MQRVVSWSAVALVAAALSCRGGGDAAPPRVPVVADAGVTEAGAAGDPGATGGPGAADGATAGEIGALGLVDAGPAPPLDAATSGDAALATIIDWPVAWSPERERLMLAYRRAHSDPAATDLAIAPRLIVLHHTGGDSAQHSHDYFDRTRLEEARAQLRKGGAANVISHFLVDRDGTIYRLIPEDRMGRHAIGVNHVAIGVENVGGGADHPLTEAQAVADAALIRDLATRHPIELVVGHHEVRLLEGTPWFVERVRGYRNAKPDPGAAFMAKVRALLGDSPLATPPR